MSRRGTPAKRAKSSGPSLGIWWDAGQQGLLLVRVLFVQPEGDSAIVVVGKLHANEWRRMQRAYPLLHRMQYFELPRGRVVYRDGTFVVQLDQRSVKLTELHDRIIRAFRLPRDKTVVVHEPEYDLRRTTSIPFPLWLHRQLQRSDEVGFFARLVLENDASWQLRSAVDNPDALERTYSTVQGKVASSARNALAEWKAGEPLAAAP